MTRKITTLGDLLDRAVERSCERKKLDRDEVPALRQSAAERRRLRLLESGHTPDPLNPELPARKTSHPFGTPEYFSEINAMRKYKRNGGRTPADGVRIPQNCL